MSKTIKGLQAGYIFLQILSDKTTSEINLYLCPFNKKHQNYAANRNESPLFRGR